MTLKPYPLGILLRMNQILIQDIKLKKFGFSYVRLWDHCALSRFFDEFFQHLLESWASFQKWFSQRHKRELEGWQEICRMRVITHANCSNLSSFISKSGPWSKWEIISFAIALGWAQLFLLTWNPKCSKSKLQNELKKFWS